jgi:hypothetical protein
MQETGTEVLLRVLRTIDARSVERSRAMEMQLQEHTRSLAAMTDAITRVADGIHGLRQDTRGQVEAIEGLRQDARAQAERLEGGLQELRRDARAQADEVRTNLREIIDTMRPARDRASGEELGWWKRASGNVSKACHRAFAMVLAFDAQLPKRVGYFFWPNSSSCKSSPPVLSKIDGRSYARSRNRRPQPR